MTSMTSTLLFLPKPYEHLLLCGLQQFLSRNFFERNQCPQLFHILGKLTSGTSYSRCSLQTVDMSTCKSNTRNAGFTVFHKSSGWHIHGSMLWIYCPLRHSVACTSGDSNHIPQHLHSVDMAAAHGVAPGIPKTVGSESGVEFNKGSIYCSNKKPWKSPQTIPFGKDSR